MRIKKGTSLMQRKAGEVKRYRQEKKIIPIVMGCIALLTVIVYVVSLLYTRFGSFTISVNKYHSLNYGLTLSETRDFTNPTPNLTCKGAKELTNIDGTSLDDKDFGVHDGEAHEKNVFVYTFYCKNSGQEEIDYRYSIEIVSMSMDIEKAVRIRLITSLNGGEAKTVDYARAKGIDENQQPIPEPAPHGTVPFTGQTTVCINPVNEFKPGDIMKYTIAMWLEGPDQDCVDDVIGGNFKIGMKFEVVNHREIVSEN